MALRRLTFIISALIMIVLLNVSAYATSSVEKRYVNKTGVTKDTLRILFNRPVKASTEVSANVSPFTIKANANGDSTVILTGDTLSNNDTTVCLVAAIAADGLQINSIKWSGNVTVVGTDTLSIRRCEPSPTPTPFLGTWGILALLLLLAGTAWFVLSRRKVRTTGSAA